MTPKCLLFGRDHPQELRGGIENAAWHRISA